MMNLQYMIPNIWLNNFQELLQQLFRIDKGSTVLYTGNVMIRISPVWDRTPGRLPGHLVAAFWITYVLAYELCLQTSAYPYGKTWNGKTSSAVPCLCLPSHWLCSSRYSLKWTSSHFYKKDSKLPLCPGCDTGEAAAVITGTLRWFCKVNKVWNCAGCQSTQNFTKLYKLLLWRSKAFFFNSLV